MFIYNISGKGFNNIILKEKSNTLGFTDTTQLYREFTNLTRKEEVHWEYEPYREGVKIKRCLSGVKDYLLVPEKINNLPVLSIASYAFSDTVAEEIIMPYKQSIILDDYAMANLTRTKKVMMLLDYICKGHNTFSNSPNLHVRNVY